MEAVYALLKLPNDVVYYMKKKRIIIGRSSVVCKADIDVGPSSYVSRHHIEILYKGGTLKLRCKGKNGIFIGKTFQPKGPSLRSIPSRCTLRFPSTSIIIKIKKCLKSSSPIDNCDEKHDEDLYTPAMDFPLTQKRDMNFLEPDESPLSSSEPLSSASRILTHSRTRRKQALIPSDRNFNRLHFKSRNSSEAMCPNVPKLESNVELNATSELSSNQNPIIPNNQLESKSGFNDNPPTLVSQTPVPKPSLVIGNLQNLVSKPSSYRSVICLAQLATLDRGDRFNKPPYSYAQLIAQAIASQPDHQLTLSGIYDYISSNYPYYQPTDKGWQNSVRHNLSLNRQFIKVPRSQDDHGKGCFWRIDPMYEAKLLTLAFRKRRIRGFEAVSRMQTVSRNLGFLCRPQDSRYIIPTSTFNKSEPISTSSTILNDSIKTVYAISTCNSATRPVQVALEIPNQISHVSSHSNLNQRLPNYPIRFIAPKTALKTVLQSARALISNENNCSLDSLPNDTDSPQSRDAV